MTRPPPALRRLSLILGLAIGPLVLSAGCRRAVSEAAVPSVEAAERSGIAFEEVAVAAGLGESSVIPGERPLTILQGTGYGCAFLDYDDEGNLDILRVGARGAKLYRGDGRGHFADVTNAVGMTAAPSAPEGVFQGCAVGDIDNDGFPDIYLSGYHAGTLLHNERGKRFVDITPAAGLKSQPWGASCVFADLTGSGRLDLIIVNYLKYDASLPRPRQLCSEKGVETACSPLQYDAERPTHYRNLDGLRFADESEKRGLHFTRGKGLGIAVTTGLDGEGVAPALLLANDLSPGDLMRREREGRFRNDGAAAGVAYNAEGHLHSGMGADWGDFDNDGNIDAVVTTFSNEPKSLYRNLGGGVFADVAETMGLSGVQAPYVAFGVKFADFDNDGWLDLLIANGHIKDNIAQIRPPQMYRNPAQAFRNRRGRFSPVESAALSTPIVGRGLAIGDYDNDGRMDALIADAEGPPRLLHNATREEGGNWLGVRLIGTRSNRDGYGAILTATVGKRRMTRECQSGGSYLSASDKRVHFGLGAATAIETLMIRWPDGQSQTLRDISANRYLTVKEPSAPKP